VRTNINGCRTLLWVQVAAALKNLALGGRTVLCSVEKPSQRVLSYASEVLLLGGGLLVYSGPVDTMVTYFANIGTPVAGVTVFLNLHKLVKMALQNVMLR
jgi:ABC-type multidrug transport system ATPase subunit